MAFRQRQEIVIDDTFPNRLFGPVIEEMKAVKPRLLLAMPGAEVRIRGVDDNERRNLADTLDRDKALSLGRYIKAQQKDRVAYKVGDIATLLITPKKIVLKNDGEWIRDGIYGYTNVELDEAVVSTYEMHRGLAARFQEDDLLPSLVAQAAGYSVQHQLGHMSGLVSKRRPSAKDKHCHNVCVMKSPPVQNIQTLIPLLSETRFCEPCLSDLRA